jgi:hypothetical protein
LDVLDIWLIQSEGEELPASCVTFDDRRFAMISMKDADCFRRRSTGAVTPS